MTFDAQRLKVPQCVGVNWSFEATVLSLVVHLKVLGRFDFLAYYASVVVTFKNLKSEISTARTSLITSPRIIVVEFFPFDTFLGGVWVRLYEAFLVVLCGEAAMPNQNNLVTKRFIPLIFLHDLWHG